MFKWQKKVLSLLVAMFMFSFGFNCSAVEDYLIYIGCQETNCSKCGASLNFHYGKFWLPLPLRSEAYNKNCCFIHFEKNPNANIEDIYKNKDHYFCKECIVDYFVDLFSKDDNNFLLQNAKKLLRENFLKVLEFRKGVDTQTNLEISESISNNIQNIVEEIEMKDCVVQGTPFPLQYVNIYNINPYNKCATCKNNIAKTLKMSICPKGHVICFECSKKYLENKLEGCICGKGFFNYNIVVSGEDILSNYLDRVFRNNEKISKNV